MATVTRHDAAAGGVREARPLGTVARGAQAVLFISAAAQLGLGVFIWTGQADQLIPIHVAIGVVFVVALWTIVAVAARSGVSVALVGAAVAWSLIAPILGLTQDRLLEGDWHWIIAVAHIVVGVGVVACGQVLVAAMRARRQSA